MEDHLQAIIEKIKTDGIGSAEKEAAAIIEKARQEAATILENAKSERTEMLDKAKNEIARMEQTGNEAIRQAGRDLILQTRKKITAVFDTIIKSSINSSLNADTVRTVIVEVLKNWKPDESQNLSVLVNEAQLKEMEQFFTKELSSSLSSGLEIHPSAKIKAGFKVSEKDGSFYYDFTDAGLAEMISEFITPKFSQIIIQAAEKE